MIGKYERYHGTGMPRKPSPSPWASLIGLAIIVALIVLARCQRSGGVLRWWYLLFERLCCIDLATERPAPLIDFPHAILVTLKFRDHEEAHQGVSAGIEHCGARCAFTFAHLEETKP